MPISDQRMFKLWRERNAMKEQVAELNKRIKKRDDALIAEFERRGTKGITDAVTGEHITYIQAEPLVWNSDELEKRLRRSVRGRAILERCMVTTLDMRAIAGEHQAGHLPVAIVAECSEIKPSAPYLKGGQPSE